MNKEQDAVLASIRKILLMDSTGNKEIKFELGSFAVGVRVMWNSLKTDRPDISEIELPKVIAALLYEKEKVEPGFDPFLTGKSFDELVVLTSAALEGA